VFCHVFSYVKKHNKQNSCNVQKPQTTIVLHYFTGDFTVRQVQPCAIQSVCCERQLQPCAIQSVCCDVQPCAINAICVLRKAAAALQYVCEAAHMLQYASPQRPTKIYKHKKSILKQHTRQNHAALSSNEVLAWCFNS